MTTIRYEPAPTLACFLSSNAFVRMVVGPVGSGKSSACVMELALRAARQEPGPDGIRRSRFAVIRNTYGQLRDTTRKTFEQWLPSHIGSWNEQAFTFTIRRGNVESEVLFRALDRPEDVKKLLSLELTGAYINEAREVPREVFELLQTRVGRYPSKAQGGPTWFGIWGDTNPWHVGHWGYELFNSGHPPEGHELFEQPDGLGSDAENLDNLPPGYYERLCHGKDQVWIDEYVRSKYPLHDQGSVFGSLIEAVRQRGGIYDFPHPTDGVHWSLDLGFSDSTAAWAWRLAPGGVDVVDYLEAHGRPLSWYFDAFDAKGYSVAKFWLPHDARAKTLQTGKSVVEQFVERYGMGRVAIGPALSLEDGIQAARWLLEQTVRFHATRCAAGLKTLKEYRYAYDEAKKVYSKTPAHDFASHCGDAWRYVAVVFKKAGLLSELDEQPKPKPGFATLPSLDELFEETNSGSSNWPARV